MNVELVGDAVTVNGRPHTATGTLAVTGAGQLAPANRLYDAAARQRVYVVDPASPRFPTVGVVGENLADRAADGSFQYVVRFADGMAVFTERQLAAV